LHEIKHDGFRVIARKSGAQVRLYSRPGNDLAYRFPLIVQTLARLRSRSCIIDGEAVAGDDSGVTSFNRVRYRRHDESISLYAFDLIELNGDDLRRDSGRSPDWLRMKNVDAPAVKRHSSPRNTLALCAAKDCKRKVLTNDDEDAF